MDWISGRILFKVYGSIRIVDRYLARYTVSGRIPISESSFVRYSTDWISGIMSITNAGYPTNLISGPSIICDIFHNLANVLDLTCRSA